MKSSDLQKTLGSSVTCSGIGLHSGLPVSMTLHPAEADSGIVFCRTDVGTEASIINARYHLVTDTMLGTTLENAHGVRISTIEHLMSAFWGMGVDNALVTINGPEIPIMDGSAEPFAFLIECAGVVEQKAPRRILKIDAPITVRDGDSWIKAVPHEGFILDINIDFDHHLIANQHAHYDFSPRSAKSQTSFKQIISRARTFGFSSDVEKLKKAGLARGGSLDNAIVVGENSILNEGGLRFEDEFVRHKALDCLGDFFLAGMRIEGHVTTSRPGHGINNKFLKALFAQRGSWHSEPPAQIISLSRMPMSAAVAQASRA